MRNKGQEEKKKFEEQKKSRKRSAAQFHVNVRILVMSFYAL